MVSSSFFTDGPTNTGEAVAPAAPAAFYADPAAAASSAAQAADSALAAAASAAAAALAAANAASASIGKADINSPTFTGIPTSTAPANGDNSTRIATTAWVQANAVGSAPATATPIMDGTAAVGVASKYAREDHVHPTDTSRASVTYVNSQIATVAPVTYVDAQDATKAPLASPALTGTPTAPTPTAGDNSTKIATTAFVAAAVVAPAYPPGHIYGLTLSNNVGTPNTQVDIASGAARDIGDTQNLKLTSGLTKSLGSVWAAGSGSGGLDTGTTANSTSYFVFLIGTTAGVIDALFSTSPTSPVMPSGYTTKRRIGSVTTDSAGNIKLFYQVPGTGEVHWRSTSAPRDVNNVSVTGLTATLFSVSTPIGIKVRGIFLFNTGSGTGACSISDPDAGPPPDNTYSQASAGNFDEVVSWTSTASKVYVTTGATGTVNVWTKGWYDYRDAAF